MTSTDTGNFTLKNIQGLKGPPGFNGKEGVPGAVYSGVNAGIAHFTNSTFKTTVVDAEYEFHDSVVSQTFNGTLVPGVDGTKPWLVVGNTAHPRRILLEVTIKSASDIDATIQFLSGDNATRATVLGSRAVSLKANEVQHIVFDKILPTGGSENHISLKLSGGGPVDIMVNGCVYGKVQ